MILVSVSWTKGPQVALFDCLFRSMYIFFFLSFSLSLSPGYFPLRNEREHKENVGGSENII